MAKAQREKGCRFEREIASLFGVRRRLRADYSESAPDIETDDFIIECKRRAAISAIRWLEQAEGYAEDSGKIPVVFAREDRGDAIVILRAADFMALLPQHQPK